MKCDQNITAIQSHNNTEAAKRTLNTLITFHLQVPRTPGTVSNLRLMCQTKQSLVNYKYIHLFKKKNLNQFVNWIVRKLIFFVPYRLQYLTYCATPQKMISSYILYIM